MLSKSESENQNESHALFKSIEHFPRSSKSHFVQMTIGALALIFITIIGAIAYIELLRCQQFREFDSQIKALRHDVEKLKARIVEKDSLIAEMRAFEDEFGSDDEYDDSEEDNFDEDINFTTRNSDKQANKPPLETETTVKYDRQKREIVSTTKDGISILAEPYEFHRNNNGPSHNMNLYRRLSSSAESNPVYHHNKHRHHSISTQHESTPVTVYARSSYVKPTNEDKSKAFRQVVKKSSLNPSYRGGYIYQAQKAAPDKVEYPSKTKVNPRYRKYRAAKLNHSHIAGHFIGNRAEKIPSREEHFRDWTYSNWMHTRNLTNYLTMDRGSVIVTTKGLYYVYAQIYYIDVKDSNGYDVLNNNIEILSCAYTSESLAHHNRSKANSCFTAGIFELKPHDKISIRDFTSQRYHLMEWSKSFFGIFKLGH